MVVRTLLIALFSAGAAAVSLGNDLADGPEVQAPPEQVATVAAAPAPTAPPDRDAYLAPIVRRSLFDASKAGQDPEAEDEGEDDEVEADVAFVLIGIMAAVPSHYSSALIQAEEQDAAPRVYTVGEELAPGVVLEKIEPRRISLRMPDGELAYMDLLTPAERLERRRSQSAGGEAVVRRTSPDHYEVSDAALATLYEDPTQVVAQVTTRRRGGGVRLSRVARASPLRKLGIHNGDVVLSINGAQVGSAKALTEALSSLRYAGDFTVEMRRRRKGKTVHFDVL